VQLAIDALTLYVRENRVMAPPEDLLAQFPGLCGRAGVFVSLKKSGELRGCLGTIEPVRETIAHEIVENAVSAASRDPRFPPVEAMELMELAVSVDVLNLPERVVGLDALDTERFGVIVKCGDLRGLLLPALEGITSVDQQVAIARQKAGLCDTDVVELWRFEVTRYF
jgi:AmmeMemoRadiSam system protein A